jgi:hypothetical protein
MLARLYLWYRLALHRLRRALTDRWIERRTGSAGDE